MKLYPSAPIGNNDLERRLEKRVNDVNGFNLINNIEKRLLSSKIKIMNRKRDKNSKMLTTILKSFDTFVIIATTSSSITLSLTGIGLP